MGEGFCQHHYIAVPAMVECVQKFPVARKAPWGLEVLFVGRIHCVALRLVKLCCGERRRCLLLAVKPKHW